MTKTEAKLIMALICIACLWHAFGFIGMVGLLILVKAGQDKDL